LPDRAALMPRFSVGFTIFFPLTDSDVWHTADSSLGRPTERRWRPRDHLAVVFAIDSTTVMASKRKSRPKAALNWS